MVVLHASSVHGSVNLIAATRTKYRKKLLRADVAVRPQQLVRDICSELEVEILKGHVSKDHVHLFVSCPPHVSPSYLMQRVKGKSSRKLLQQFSHLNKECLSGVN